MSELFDFPALGKRIKELRGKDPRNSFAEEYLVAPSSLARWEAGESQPDMGFLIRLVSSYGVSLEWLITGKEEEPRKTGRIEADEQLRYLDKVDWWKTKNGKTADVGSAAKQHAENIDSDKNKTADVGSFNPLYEELRSLEKEMRQLLKENADLRVENERLKHQLEILAERKEAAAGVTKRKVVGQAG